MTTPTTETTPGKEIFRALSAPFPASDIEWRMQSSGMNSKGPWGKCLAYVTARAIMERLDSTVGPENWQDDYTPGPDGGVICRLAVRIGGEWITKVDGAENTDVEAVKGGLSSALKRAAVKWGIGRYLYNLDEGWANFSENGATLAKIKDKQTGSEAWHKWDPPTLPDWALPGGSGKPSAPGASKGIEHAPKTSTTSQAPAAAPQAQKPAATTPQAPKAPAPTQQAPAHQSDGAAQGANGWRHVTVPKFIKKYAGQPLENMAEADLLWWAENYQPKPFQGRISPADVAFRSALDKARDELQPMAPSEPEAPQESPADEDVPF